MARSWCETFRRAGGGVSEDAILAVLADGLRGSRVGGLLRKEAQVTNCEQPAKSLTKKLGLVVCQVWWKSYFRNRIKSSGSEDIGKDFVQTLFVKRIKKRTNSIQQMGQIKIVQSSFKLRFGKLSIFRDIRKIVTFLI